MKVLVTGAGALLGQGILRSLQRSPLQPTIVAADPSPLAAGLYWADYSERIAMANDPNYLNSIETVIAKHRPDFVFIGTDVELLPLATQRAYLEATYHTHVVVSSPEVVRIADDKYETVKFFQKHGFAAPDSVLPGSELELVRKYGFPLVVKPRIGARSIGFRIVRSESELNDAIRSTTEPVIQQCLGNDAVEYTAGSITFDGECDAVIVMRRDLRDGNTYRAFVERSDELEDTVRRWAEALGAYGPANFQFRIDNDGLPKVFEINGRFSGTTPLRALAGFPEVDMVIRHLMFKEKVEQPKIELVTILRHWSETVVKSDELLR